MKKNILKNSGTKCSEVEYDIKSEIGQKELKGDLGKMQKKVEDLETELQFKNKEIEDQQVKIDSISFSSICQDLRMSYLEIEALNTQLKYGFHNKSFILNAPLVSCPFPVIRFGWVCCCTHPKRMTGNGQLTRGAFGINDLLRNPHFT